MTVAAASVGCPPQLLQVFVSEAVGPPAGEAGEPPQVLAGDLTVDQHYCWHGVDTGAGAAVDYLVLADLTDGGSGAGRAGGGPDAALLDAAVQHALDLAAPACGGEPDGVGHLVEAAAGGEAGDVA